MLNQLQSRDNACAGSSIPALSEQNRTGRSSPRLNDGLGGSHFLSLSSFPSTEGFFEPIHTVDFRQTWPCFAFLVNQGSYWKRYRCLHLPAGFSFSLQTRDLLLACDLAPVFRSNLSIVPQTFVQSRELSWIEAVPSAALLAGSVPFPGL